MLPLLAIASMIGSAPSNVRLTQLGPSLMKLDWADNATGETGYLIQRRAQGATDWTSTTIAQVATPGLVSYVDTTINGCANYEYRVGAYDDTSTWWSVPDTSAGAILDVTNKRKMWVSPGTGVAQDGDLTLQATRDAIIGFAVSNGVNLIAVSAYPYLNKATVPSNPSDPVNTALSPFIQSAYANGISVELTYGANNWPTTASSWALDLLQNYVVPYLTQTGAYATAGLPPSMRVGVEFDIESWTGWTSTNWKTAAVSYLNFLQSATNVIHGSSTGNPNQLRVDVDLAFWLDDGCWAARDGRHSGACTVTWNGTSGLISDFAQATTDAASFMDYRNNVPYVEAGVQHELAYANSIQGCRRAYVGIDTDCANDGTTLAISCVGGTANASTDATLVSNVFSPVTSYFWTSQGDTGSLGGMAIWHEASWAALPSSR